MKYLACALLLLSMAAQGSTDKETNMTPSTFLEALQSETRSLAIAPESDLYGWLVGSWTMRVVDYGDDGSKHETRAEWHFARVLEGRAIQDVFIVPSRDQRNAATPRERNRYGTSVRVYDSGSNTWRITWFNPVRNVENHLVGRKVGNEIVQEGRDSDGSLMRWCFRDITANSFRWTGEASVDGGKTWRLGAEFFGERLK